MRSPVRETLMAKDEHPWTFELADPVATGGRHQSAAAQPTGLKNKNTPPRAGPSVRSGSSRAARTATGMTSLARSPSFWMTSMNEITEGEALSCD